MKIKYAISIFAIIILLCPIIYAQSAAQEYYNQSLKFNTPGDFQRWTVLDDFNFDKINNWDLSAPAQQNPQAQTTENQLVVLPIYKKITPGVIFSRIESGRFLRKEYENNLSCLGIKVNFPEQNKMDVILWPKETYKINGYCKKISLWLLGRGDNVDFKIVLKDYLNRLYYVPVTKMDFLGWKYFEVNAPSVIPQSFSPFPQKELIEITGFLVSNNPSPYADIIYKPFYLYIDQLEVLIDQYYESYAGVEITDGW